MYAGKKKTKELSEFLEQKYKTDDAGTKKIVGDYFLDYKMVEYKIVTSQVQELHIIL